MCRATRAAKLWRSVSRIGRFARSSMQAPGRTAWHGQCRNKESAPARALRSFQHSAQREETPGRNMNRTDHAVALGSSRKLTWLLVGLLGVAPIPLVAQVKAKPPVKTPSSGGNSFDGPGDVRYRPER